MRTTIVAYTSGEAEKVKWAGLVAGAGSIGEGERWTMSDRRANRDPTQLLTPVKRDGGFAAPPAVRELSEGLIGEFSVEQRKRSGNSTVRPNREPSRPAADLTPRLWVPAALIPVK